jgi:Fic family protein
MIFQPLLQDSSELQGLLLQAGFIRQQILLTPLNPRLELEWQFQTSIEATHHSTAIEGNPLTLEEVRRLLSGQPLLKPRNRELEVAHYKVALDWIHSEWTGRNKFLTGDVILHLHSLIMQDLELQARLKKWRLDPVFVFDTGTQLPVHEGDPAEEVKDRIEALCHWLNTTNQHPVIRAAVAHLEFVRIHPFMDGNGRTARLLETLLLSQYSWDARGLIALEPYYRKNLAQYYKMIALSLSNQNWTAWVTFVSQAMLAQLQELEKRLQHNLVHQEFPLLHERQWRILGLLNHPQARISNADVQRQTSASHMTAARDLAQLVQLGLLEKHGAGRATRYSRK